MGTQYMSCTIHYIINYILCIKLYHIYISFVYIYIYIFVFIYSLLANSCTLILNRAVGRSARPVVVVVRRPCRCIPSSLSVVRRRSFDVRRLSSSCVVMVVPFRRRRSSSLSFRPVVVIRRRPVDGDDGRTTTTIQYDNDD